MRRLCVGKDYAEIRYHSEGNSSITFYEVGYRDSGNRREDFQLEALTCLVPRLGLIYRAHASFYENEMPPVYRYPRPLAATGNNDRYLSLPPAKASEQR